jgi:hypothetical protein
MECINATELLRKFGEPGAPLQCSSTTDNVFLRELSTPENSRVCDIC